MGFTELIGSAIATPHVPDWTEADSFGACYDSARRDADFRRPEQRGSGNCYQLWGYDGTDWTQKTPTGPTPVTANTGLMTFDSFRNVAVLLGGYAQSVPTPFPDPQDSVWEWDGSIWHERQQSGQTLGSAGATDVFAFDTLPGRIRSLWRGVRNYRWSRFVLPSFSLRLSFCLALERPGLASRSSNANYRHRFAASLLHGLRHFAQRPRALRRTER